jgi:hypothetical protein
VMEVSNHRRIVLRRALRREGKAIGVLYFIGLGQRLFVVVFHY